MDASPPLITQAQRFADRIAVSDSNGEFTYAELIDASSALADRLLGARQDLAGSRTAFLVPPSFDYVTAQWAIWRSGGVAVPLCLSHPRPELEYVIEDSGADTLVATVETESRLRPIAHDRGLRLVEMGRSSGALSRTLPEVAAERPAMIVYTSGTTGGPKGVVTTHANIAAQIESLVEAWEWGENDRIPSVLPLHHVHGIINVVGCALWSGARCDMVDRFDAVALWSRFVDTSPTLFMAVPTIYARLIRAFQDASSSRRHEWTEACSTFRLMVSGSAALPTRLFELWRQISSHTLLERYGMTEIGMALSNPLHGERRPGHVGQPLPGVEVRRVDEHGDPVDDATPGEIEVRGPGVFGHYWERPEESSSSFRDGWFRTGDVAVVDEGSYRILGRQSIDIIKTGGFKVSALEIEETLREHPAIHDCAVVGVPDEEWGERVAVGVVIESGSKLTLDLLRSWTKERLASYKAPTLLLRLDDLPRNALGKVVKSELRSRFTSQ